jgi:hypothetical protein
VPVVRDGRALAGAPGGLGRGCGGMFRSVHRAIVPRPARSPP